MNRGKTVDMLPIIFGVVPQWYLGQSVYQKTSKICSIGKLGKTNFPNNSTLEKKPRLRDSNDITMNNTKPPLMVFYWTTIQEVAIIYSDQANLKIFTSDYIPISALRFAKWYAKSFDRLISKRQDVSGFDDVWSEGFAEAGRKVAGQRIVLVQGTAKAEIIKNLQRFMQDPEFMALGAEQSVVEFYVQGLTSYLHTKRKGLFERRPLMRRILVPRDLHSICLVQVVCKKNG